MNNPVLSFRAWAVITLAGLLLASRASGAEVVISQVYGGGGNSGATFRNDFVELFNRSASAVSLLDWSVQYASSAGTTWQIATLSGALEPGAYFLLQLGSGGANGQPLPAADATGTLNLSATAGKVALVRNVLPLTSACPTSPGIEDFVGYGSSAACFEGSGPSPAPSAVLAAFRAGDGCADFTNNVTDFFTSTPAPRNRFSTRVACGDSSVPRALHDIQGTGARSPLVGRSVTTTGNIVTALRNNGFFLQSPDAETDADPATSEAVFVETFGTPPSNVAVGNAIVVSGFVEESTPSSDPTAPPRTQIINPTITVLATGAPLPAAVTLAPTDLPPTGNGSSLEKFEAMRVRVDSLTVVAATEGFLQEASAIGISDGLFHGVLAGWPRPFREPGIPLIEPLPTNAPPGVARFDGNPERLRVDSNAQPGATRIEVVAGAVVANLTGVLDFEQRAWTLLPDPAGGFSVGGNELPGLPPPTRPGEWMLASLNLQRFFDTVEDPAVQDVVLTPTAFEGRLKKASLTILQRLGAPDILGVVEVENLSTLQTLAARLNADALTAGRSNVTYGAWLEEGTDVGGIDCGYLVNTTRVEVVNVVQIGREATYINPLTGQPQLLHDRPPLLLRALVPGETTGARLPVTCIVNHLRSLSGIDDPSDGARVRAKRRAQAEHVAALVQERQALTPPEHLILIGDFNAFEFNDGYVDVMGTIRGRPAPTNEVVLASADLVVPDLVLLTERLPAPERYSYVFDGNAQAIDHILLSPSLCARVTRHGYIRGNVDAPESFRSNFNRPERLSDHDAAVAWFGTGDAPMVLSAVIRDGEVELELLSGVPGSLRIEASSNLRDWTEAGQLDTDECGRATFRESASPQGRFYRATRP